MNKLNTRKWLIVLTLTSACASSTAAPRSTPPVALPQAVDAQQAERMFEARKLIIKEGHIARIDGNVDRREMSMLRLNYKQAKEAYYDRQWARRGVLGGGAFMLGVGAFGLYIANLVNNTESASATYYEDIDSERQLNRLIGGAVSLGAGIVGAGVATLIYYLMDTEDEVFVKTYNLALKDDISERAGAYAQTKAE